MFAVSASILFGRFFISFDECLKHLNGYYCDQKLCLLDRIVIIDVRELAPQFFDDNKLALDILVMLGITFT